MNSVTVDKMVSCGLTTVKSNAELSLSMSGEFSIPHDSRPQMVVNFGTDCSHVLADLKVMVKRREMAPAAYPAATTSFTGNQLGGTAFSETMSPRAVKGALMPSLTHRTSTGFPSRGTMFSTLKSITSMATTNVPSKTSRGGNSKVQNGGMEELSAWTKRAMLSGA